MTQTALAQTEDSINLIALTRGSLVVLGLRLAGIFLMYLLQIFLARWMGTTEYGIYQYVMSWSVILSLLVTLGLPRTVVRLINEYREQKKWGLMGGIILGSWQLTIGTGLLLGLLGTGVILLINYYHQFSLAPVLLIGIWVVPLRGLLLLQQDLARGANDFFLAYTPTKVIWPILLILGAFVLWQDDHLLNSIPMIWVFCGTLGGILAIQGSWIWWKFNQEIGPITPVYTPYAWLKISLPLLLDLIFQEILVQTDTLMLGVWVGTKAVGIYSAASNTAFWVSFVLQSINPVVSPSFSILNVRNDRVALQKLIWAMSIWIFWLSTAIAVFLFIFAKPILGIFGAEFSQADWILRILVIGQLINSLSGAVATLMAMMGYQNQLMLVSCVAALTNLILNAIAIPLWGPMGAALTTTFTLSIWNLWLVVIVMRNIGVNPTVFSYLFSSPKEEG